MKKIFSLTALCIFSFCASISLFGEVKSSSLNGTWTLTYWEQPLEAIRDPNKIPASAKKIDAQVPSNVELDLLRAGLIEDPKIGSNTYSLRKFEGYQWLFEREFDAPPLAEGQRAILRLEGVDTFADVFVNGAKAGELENMLVAHKMDITKFLKFGEKNSLQILIRSSVLEAQEYFTGAISNAYELENIRKAPHMAGWDILPRIVGAGIWRGVFIDVENPARILDAHFMTNELDPKNSRAKFSVFVQSKIPAPLIGKAKISLKISRNGEKIFEKTEALNTPKYKLTRAKIEGVEPWWPRGYGEASLYDLKVDLLMPNGKIIDSVSKKIGFRTVKLLLEDVKLDRTGGEFLFLINGEKIFVRGTNWVPLSALHSEDESLMGKALEMVIDLNCNMIRCWGGNVYEDTPFFDFCDANGIMVWQDFAYACSTPPQDDNFAKLAEKEARDLIVKLRNHPSLVLWAGSNENDSQFSRFSVKNNPIDPNEERVSRSVLPKALFELDPSRPYLPCSPYISQKVFEKKALPSEDHLWGPRGYYKADFYTSSTAKFVSEIGYHGCPNRESLEKMMPKNSVYPWSNAQKLDWNKDWQAKSVCPFPDQKLFSHRNNLMAKQTRILFGEVPLDLDEFIFASQSTQAEAKKYFVEFWRSRKFEKTGIIWWNLRDGWPVISDAIVDYYNSKKKAYNYIKRSQTNVCVMMNDNLEVVAVNDTLREFEVSAKVSDIDTGEVLFDSTPMKIPANGKKIIGKLPSQEGKKFLAIEYFVDGKRAFNHYLLGTPPFKLDDYRRWIEKFESAAGK